MTSVSDCNHVNAKNAMLALNDNLTSLIGERKRDLCLGARRIHNITSYLI